MPDTSAGGAIIVVVVILAVIGFVALRRWLVRFLVSLLETASGRITFGVLLCLGGIIFGFTSGVDSTTGLYENHWPVGGGVAGAGLLLLLITFGIPYLSKRWEDAASSGQIRSSSIPDQAAHAPFLNQSAPPGAPNTPTPQPGGYMPTPQPGGFMPANPPGGFGPTDGPPPPYPPR